MNKVLYNVAFFVDNTCIKDIDLSVLGTGNPGIGGTEYQMFLSAYLLDIKCKKDFNVFLLVTDALKINSTSTSISVLDADMSNIESVCCNNQIDVIFMRNYSVTNKIGNTKTICVMNNNISYNVVRELVKRKDLYFHFLTYSSINKYISIKNIYLRSMIVPHFIGEKKKIIKKQKKEKFVIGFIGALTPLKSFDVIAKYWDTIYTKIPNAELWVFGSGNLYWNNETLGAHRLASAEYEKKIFDSIKNIEALNSIKWFGSVGHDILYEQIKYVDIGLVNPTGNGETFCLSVFDFLINNVPVLLNKNVDLYREISLGSSLYFKKYDDIPSILSQYQKSHKNIKIHIKYDDNKTIKKMRNMIIKVAKNKKAIGSRPRELFYRYKLLSRKFFKKLFK